MQSVASRLRLDLDSLTQRLVDLIQKLPVERRDLGGDGVFIVAPEYYWGEPSVDQLKIQLDIKRDYEEWFEVFGSVFARATDDLNRRIQKADHRLRNWIELRSNWSLELDPASNKRSLQGDVKDLIEILEVIAAGDPAPPIIIPDTNAIVSRPDPVKYRSIAGGSEFIFLLLPTVLAELDSLKNLHRNPEFREKVYKTIKRIKGWRNQGSLRHGTTVNGDIIVKAVAVEPNMHHTLTWLDEENRDDRIIASVLEVQSSYPNARVVLVTEDVNLLNKADLARMESTDMLSS